ncbi:MAG: S8 family serine peptidase [Ignavibacteria bacterium]|nr:S8 family serine peptidase [Ignavibacteria bacterium]
MKKLIYFLPMVLVTAYFSLTGWSSDNAGSKEGVITSYYYYQGQPFNMKLKSNIIFVQTKSVLSQAELNSVIGQVMPAATVSKFQNNDTKQFINIPANTDEASVQSLIKTLKTKPEIASAGPVFSPDEGKTLIGVQNEATIQFKNFLSQTDIDNFLSSRGLQIIMKLNVTGGATYLVRTPNADNSTAIDAANEVYRSGMVNYSEPNLYFTNLYCYMPNDPFINRQWSVRNTGNNIPEGIAGTPGCDMQVDSAWEISKGIPQVIIGVSDTGIDTLHEDLSANLVPGTGWNWYNNTPGCWDDGNHGTCCSGIIAAVGNNSKGISGVAPNCRLVGSKWLNASGSGDYTGASNSIIWAAAKGCWVISNSWGFVGGASSLLDNALNDAANLGRGGKGIVLCFASGNENGAMRYPASSHPKLIVVGGLSPCNQRKSTNTCDGETWWGASYGNTLNIVAPCTKIYATDRSGSVGYTPTNYDSTFNGTSSATPNTAGVVALMLSVDSTLRWDTLRAYIGRTAQRVGSYSYTTTAGHNDGTWNNEMGYGKINSYQAVKYTLLKKANYPLSSFNLQSPAAGTRIVTFPGSTTPVTFNWDTSATGAGYKLIFGSPTTSTRRITLPSGANMLSMTLSELDNVLALAGFTNNGSASDSAVGQWDIWAYKVPTAPGPDSMKATNGPRAITLRRGRVQVTPFALINPLNNARIITAPNDNSNLTMSWRSGGPGLKYKFQFDSPTFSGPVMINIPTANDGFDTTLTIVNSVLDGMLQTLGIARGDSIVGQWRAYAFSGPTDSTASGETRSLTLRRVGMLALNESFIGTTFVPVEWTYTGTGTQYWTRQAPGGYGATVGSAMFDYYSASGGTTQSLTSNQFPAVTSGDRYLRFNYAHKFYQPTTTLSADSMAIYTSTDAGTTWSRLITLIATNTPALGYNSTTNMTTTGAIGNNTEYMTPANNEWATKLLQMPLGTNKVRFTALSAFGNNLFIDDITAGSATGTGNQLAVIPENYSLSQNYPNPFNPTTKINFALPKQGFVTLRVFDITGREIAKLFSGVKEAGYHSVDFNAVTFSSGVYFYRIEAADFVDTKRMVLVK